MLVLPGYYQIDRQSTDSEWDELLTEKKILLASAVYYQHGARVWELYYVPKAFELGPIDSFLWSGNMRAATEKSRAEDMVSAEQLGESGTPGLDAIEEALEVAEDLQDAIIDAARPTAGVFAVVLGGLGLAWVLRK